MSAGGPGPGRPPATRGPEYEQLLTEFRAELDRPTVGHPGRDAELAELRRLIGRYPEEARAYLAHIKESGV